MAKNPVFPLYAQDFLIDVLGWDNERVGFYMRLLATEWINGALPNDEKELAKIGSCHDLQNFRELWEMINFKFQENGNGKLINKRLEQVRKEQEEYRRKKSKAGKQGGNPAFKKGKPNPYL